MIISANERQFSFAAARKKLTKAEGSLTRQGVLSQQQQAAGSQQDGMQRSLKLTVSLKLNNLF